MGVPGYDIEYSAERFKRRGLKYDPDMVIWFIRDDDFVQINEKMQPINEKCEEESRVNGYYTVGFDQNKLYDCWRISNEKVEKEMGRAQLNAYLKDKFDMFNNIFHKTLLVIDFPFDPEAYKQLIKDLVREKGNQYFYDHLINIFDYNESLPDGHPNSKGYTLISKDIYDYLNRNKIITCN